MRYSNCLIVHVQLGIFSLLFHGSQQFQSVKLQPEKTNFTGTVKKANYVEDVSTQLINQQPIQVKMNARSNLFAQSGQTINLYYDVTNNEGTPTYTQFFCNGMYSFPLNIQPTGSWIYPEETKSVKVVLQVRQNVQYSTDTVSFTISGPYTVTHKAYIYIGQNQLKDTNAPDMSYSITGYCIGHDYPSVCRDTTWTLQGTIQDRESGILSVQSVPDGIQSPTNFIVGTRDAVTITYSATCCATKVEIITTDIAGNQNKQQIDINNVWLSAGTTIAIILGIILVIILLCLVVFTAFKCIQRKRRQTFSIES